MNYVQLLPAVIGIIAVGVIAYFIARAVRLYRRDRQTAQSLPQPETIERAAPKDLERGRRQIAAEIQTSLSGLQQHEVEIALHALWTAMLLEATSDGSIDRREMALVTELFGGMSGRPVTLNQVIGSAEQVQHDKSAALSEIAKAARVGSAIKSHILAGALLVSVSDQSLEQSETGCLGDIADALSMAGWEREAVFEGLAKRLGV